MKLGIHHTARKTRLLDIIEHYDIGANPAPDALFSFDVSTLSIWCVSTDHPGGLWDQYPWRMDPSSHLTKKDAEPLSDSMFIYSEAAQDIIGFSLQTKARSLSSRGLLPRDAIENRPDDVAWATRKLVWLWEQACPGEPPPHIQLIWDRDEPKQDFSDFF